MGILSIFSRDPGQRVQALRKKIQERYGQPEGRQQAMDKLLDMGTPEAIAALLTRFTVNVEPSITDAEEKEYLFKSLVDMGEKAVDPIQTFLLRSDDAASWALRLLDQLIAPEALVAFCIEALRKIGPDYTRDPEKKLVLISTLAKREGDAISEAIIPFLEDPADDVRIEAAYALARQAKECAREKGYSFLQVKTVRMGQYPEYDETNHFYLALGFKEFEVFPLLWDEKNPCQIYVMTLR